jgi:O-antigen/teichoic acid export membrane protein
MTSEAAQIKQNSVYYSFAVISRLFANSIVLIVVNNVYGKEISGNFLTAFVFAGLFIPLADFGLDLLLTTEIARDKENIDTIFNELLPVKIIFLLLSCCIIWVLAFAKTFSTPARIMLLILSLYTVFSSLTNFFSGLFRGLEKLKIDAKVSIINNTFLVIMIAVFSLLKMSIVYIALIYVAARFFNVCLSFYYVRKYVKNIKIIFSIKSIIGIKNKVMDFGLNMFMGNLFSQYDTVWLQQIKGETAVGIYQGAARIFSIPYILLDVFTTSYTPTLARYNATDEKNWRKLGFILNKTLMFIALPIAALLILYPEQIIKIIYFHQDFSESVNVLRLFGLFILIRFFTETSALMLTTSKRQNKRMKVVFIAVFASIPVYCGFIFVYGIIGAIIAQLVCNTIAGGIYIVLAYKDVKQWFFVKEIVIVALFFACMFFVLYLLRDISFLITMPVFTAVFIMFAYRYGYNSDEKIFVFPNIKSIILNKK